MCSLSLTPPPPPCWVCCVLLPLPHLQLISFHGSELISRKETQRRKKKRTVTWVWILVLISDQMTPAGSIREQRMWRCLSILSSSATALSRFCELLSLSPDSYATYFALIHKMRYNCMCNSECFSPLYIFAVVLVSLLAIISPV